MKAQHQSIKRRIYFGILLLLVCVAGGFWLLRDRLHRSDDQITITIHAYENQPDDLSKIALDSDYVVEGVVKKVLPSQWTTDDGKRPADVHAAISNLDIQLRTPVQISVKTVFQGQIEEKDLVFSMLGGNDGVYEIRVAGAVELEPGMEILVFLSKASSDAGSWAKISSLYPQLYFIVEGETLHGPLKDIDYQDFVEQFGEGVQQ
jgi:hypothetical protein